MDWLSICCSRTCTVTEAERNWFVTGATVSLPDVLNCWWLTYRHIYCPLDAETFLKCSLPWLLTFFSLEQMKVKHLSHLYFKVRLWKYNVPVRNVTTSKMKWAITSGSGSERLHFLWQFCSDSFQNCLLSISLFLLRTRRMSLYLVLQQARFEGAHYIKVDGWVGEWMVGWLIDWFVLWQNLCCGARYLHSFWSIVM